MKRRIAALFILMLFLQGCSTFREHVDRVFRVRPTNAHTEIDGLRFEKTLDSKVQGLAEKPKVTIRFEGVTLSRGMQLLTEMSGVPIVFSQALDEHPLSGTFIDQPLPSVLESIARRYGMSLTEVSGVYYMGDYQRHDSVTAVIRIPPVDRQELLEGVKGILTEYGTVNVVGSVLWVSDRLETVRKIADDLENIRNRTEKSYVAEVFFIRVREDDFVQFTADLRFKAVDVFASGVNLEQLFECVLDGSAGLGSSSVESRPVLYLSEGRKARFYVGSEIVRESKAVTEQGIIQTTGYEAFTDGLELTLQLSRISDERYSIDLGLDISTFEKETKTEIVPKKVSSVLESPGLLLRDGEIRFGGMLKRKDKRKVWSLFGIEGSNVSDVLTIWLRVREVR